MATTYCKRGCGASWPKGDIIAWNRHDFACPKLFRNHRTLYFGKDKTQ